MKILRSDPVQEFNHQRPHEALGQQTPASVYAPSPRAYPGRVPKVEYPSGVLTKRVYRHGDIAWQGRRVFLNQALAGEEVAFEGLADGLWLVRFGEIKLAQWNERKWQLKELSGAEAKS